VGKKSIHILQPVKRFSPHKQSSLVGLGARAPVDLGWGKYTRNEGGGGSPLRKSGQTLKKKKSQKLRQIPLAVDLP